LPPGPSSPMAAWRRSWACGTGPWISRVCSFIPSRYSRKLATSYWRISYVGSRRPFDGAAMNIQNALRRITERQNLSQDEVAAVMRAIVTGECTPPQNGGCMVGLRMKGETVDEITAAARVMRELATGIKVDTKHLVDTCGTGGDARGTFNVSTASAFVVAAAGGKVAKHGNRSVSSKSGSADLLEAAGARLELSPRQVERCIEEVG